jgi:hypothetical protein
LYEPNITEVSPAALEDGVRRVRQRPLLYGVLVVAFFGFGLWYMTGGSATGSPHQAEQLILAGGGTDPYLTGLAPQAAVATAHCTQNSQGVFTRLYGLIVNTNQAGNAASNDPSTYYTCSGTATTGPADVLVRHVPASRQSLRLAPSGRGTTAGRLLPKLVRSRGRRHSRPSRRM